MRALIGLTLVAWSVSGSARANDIPVFSAGELQSLRLPDVSIGSVEQRDGATSNAGARVPHLEVHGNIRKAER